MDKELKIALTIIIVIVIAGTIIGYVLNNQFFNETYQGLKSTQSSVREFFNSENYLTLDEFTNYSSMLETGDILVTRNRQLNTILYPGKWKHNIIYVGNKDDVMYLFGNRSIPDKLSSKYVSGDEIFIIDSGRHGVSLRELKEPYHLNNRKVLVATAGFHLNKSQAEKQNLIVNALELVGKDYDLFLNIDNNESFYCSELVYEEFKVVDIYLNNKHSFLGKKIILPQDVFDAMSNSAFFEKKFDIRKENGIIVDII